MGILKPILLSVLVHLTLVMLARFIPAPKPPQASSVEIEILPTQNEDSKRIVRQPLVDDKMKTQDNEDPLRFWSEEKQRVIKQMRAAISGITQNRSQESQPKKQKPQPQKKDFDPFAELNPSYRPQNSKSEKGVSTVGNDLSDLEIGAITALNTDRYLYYSFYNRVETVFRSRWEPYVRRAQRMLPDSAFANTANEKWTTVVEIWLKQNGEFHSYHVLKSSGIRLFDEAATQAFVEARMFPNPPKDKIEDDGLVKIKYQLTVLHNPTLTARMKE
jgi:TonB family protein